MDSKRSAASLLRSCIYLLVLSVGAGCAHNGSSLPSKGVAFLTSLLPASKSVRPALPSAPPETAKPVEGAVKSAQLAVELPSLWPVKDNAEHVILSSFGYRGGRRGGPGAFHRAVDIRAAMNTQVVATANGTIKETSNGGGYGKMVVVDHGNGFETAYAHLNDFNVDQGQRVARGELIALSGQTGYATCPHVHYEVRKNGEAVNPVDFLPMDGVRIEQLASLPPAGLPAQSKSAEPVAKPQSSASKADVKGKAPSRPIARAVKSNVGAPSKASSTGTESAKKPATSAAAKGAADKSKSGPNIGAKPKTDPATKSAAAPSNTSAKPASSVTAKSKPSVGSGAAATKNPASQAPSAKNAPNAKPQPAAKAVNKASGQSSQG